MNTHRIETPNGVVVIDVQRDLTHTREALAAVRAVGKPVSTVPISHGHYAGIGLFKQAWPEAAVFSSRLTRETARTDHYGFNKIAAQLAPGDFPDPVVLSDRAFADNATLEFDGVEIVTREMGRAEANGGTAFYVPVAADRAALARPVGALRAFRLAPPGRGVLRGPARAPAARTRRRGRWCPR